jgi:hypothetical protein
MAERMSDPHEPATAPGTDPGDDGPEFGNVQEVARELSLGTESQRF